MKCGYCGEEFTEDEGIKGCGRCGRPDSCNKVRCPRCFYENVPEPKLLRRVKKLLEKK